MLCSLSLSLSMHHSEDTQLAYEKTSTMWHTWRGAWTEETRERAQNFGLLCVCLVCMCVPISFSLYQRCRSAQREKDYAEGKGEAAGGEAAGGEAAGHLTDNRTDEEGNMETDDGFRDGGSAEGGGSGSICTGTAGTTAPAKGMVAHLGQPPPPTSHPPASALAGVSAADGMRVTARAPGDGASISSSKPAPDGQGEDGEGNEPASADLKK
jgi:hypothetical protein